jgi:hypothetical protein
MINQAICVSFIQELFQGVHNFGPSPDTFNCALYTTNATLNANTTVYVPDGEVVGPLYVAGGLPLFISQQPIITGSSVVIGFQNLSWPIGIEVVTRGCLIYNVTKGNRAVGVWDFGLDFSSIPTGKLTVKFPPVGPATAVINAN